MIVRKCLKDLQKDIEVANAAGGFADSHKGFDPFGGRHRRAGDDGLHLPNAAPKAVNFAGIRIAGKVFKLLAQLPEEPLNGTRVHHNHS